MAKPSLLEHIMRALRPKPHQADAYFTDMFRQSLARHKTEYHVLREAHAIRHRHPDLSGPELVAIITDGPSAVCSNVIS